MLSPSDARYVATKKIKLGAAKLKSPFKECVAGLREAFPGVSILNAWHDDVPPQRIPRLTVVVEYDHERRAFIDDQGNYDRTKQEKAAAIFREALKAAPDLHLDAKGLFAIFNDFESVARVEAHEKLKEVELEGLRRRLGRDRVWTICRMFDSVDVFFHVDSGLTELTDRFRQRVAEEYAALLAPHDEFGYFAKRPISIVFSSKETFDRDYQSSWRNYYH